MNTKACIAEFIATFTFVFIGVGAIAGGSTGLLGVAFAHGLAIAVMIAVTAGISGGHINPAVTIGMFLYKKIDAMNTIGYIIAQCAGAIIAIILLNSCLPDGALAEVNYGTPSLGEGVTIPMAFITEVILTFFLMFVIYGTAVDKRGMQPAALFIGLTVTLDILMGGPITGAAMNPARYIGPALLGGLEHCWLYWIAPITGSILAATTYEQLLLKD